MHGWGALHEQLNQLSRRQEWAEMGKLITDDVLDAFAVSGSPAEVAATVQQRYGDIIDRISLYTPHAPDRVDLTAVTAALRAGKPR
jgi:alkanesulfonate monooxygenase SsuD/methylene tetrahydromethanopterin reductase-like flavin-dependent oxidoreductase (luciferase family)